MDSQLTVIVVRQRHVCINANLMLETNHSTMASNHDTLLGWEPDWVQLLHLQIQDGYAFCQQRIMEVSRWKETQASRCLIYGEKDAPGKANVRALAILPPWSMIKNYRYRDIHYNQYSNRFSFASNIRDLKGQLGSVQHYQSVTVTSHNAHICHISEVNQFNLS